MYIYIYVWYIYKPEIIFFNGTIRHDQPEVWAESCADLPAFSTEHIKCIHILGFCILAVLVSGTEGKGFLKVLQRRSISDVSINKTNPVKYQNYELMAG